ncbi:MAG: cobalamin B12-binding domain-containing protein [Phycisphaerae bacterium]|nr:cobalamin B12-binding domain-containing protein [Phycisphaerae bacterium]
MKKIKVLLISPSSGLHLGRVTRPKFQTHPLGLLYLAAELEKDGHSVELCDAFSFGYDLQHIENRIHSFGPDVIGLTAMTILAPDAYFIARRAKAIQPDVLVVMGGPHATAMPAEALTDGHVDIAVRGEGERTMCEICEAAACGRGFDGIAGITHKVHGQITVNPDRAPLMDVDSVAMPAYHLLPEVAEYNPPPHWGRRGQFASLITSRGCPYGCVFCSVTRAWGKRYRFRSTENVMAEMKTLYHRYNARYFSFRDSTLTLHKPRVVKLCQAILDEGLAIRWNCNSRPNEVNEEVLGWMKRAGCETIQFGIESGDEEILRRFKNLDKERIARAVALTDAAGIKAHGYFMFGLPGETCATIAATIRFAKSLPLYSAGFTTVTPFPGSELWDYCVDRDMITTTDWAGYDLKGNSVIRYEHFEPRQLLRFQKRAFRQFYMRPGIVLHHLSRIKSVNDLCNYIKEATVNLK